MTRQSGLEFDRERPITKTELAVIAALDRTDGKREDRWWWPYPDQLFARWRIIKAMLRAISAAARQCHGRRPADPAAVRYGMTLVGMGKSIKSAAKLAGVSESTLRRHLEAAKRPPNLDLVEFRLKPLPKEDPGVW